MEEVSKEVDEVEAAIKSHHKKLQAQIISSQSTYNMVVICLHLKNIVQLDRQT